MERRIQQYSLQKPPSKRKNRFMYAVKFRVVETGEYRSAIFSGHTKRDGTVRWAENRSKSGLIGRKNPRFWE